MSKSKQKTKVHQISYLNDFQCAMAKCPDSCCANWVINVTDRNKKFYEKEAPEIIRDMESNDDDGMRMKQIGGGPCIQLEQDSSCKIHNEYGESFLPDICHSFPRSYKNFANDIYMTANLACPESLKVALYSTKKANFSSWSEIYKERIKTDSYDFKNEDFIELEQDELIDIFNFVETVIDDEDCSASQAGARLLMVASHFDQNEAFNWPIIKEKIAQVSSKEKVVKIGEDGDIDANLKKELDNVLKATFVLVNRDRPRYNVVVAMIRKVLGDHSSDKNEVWENYKKIRNKWKGSEQEKKFESIFKNLLHVQLSQDMFPIACYFRKKYSSMLNTVLEYMVVRLAVMCKNYEMGENNDFTVEDVIDVIQPTTKRFYVRREQEIFDFCKEAGWEDKNIIIPALLNL